MDHPSVINLLSKHNTFPLSLFSQFFLKKCLFFYQPYSHAIASHRIASYHLLSYRITQCVCYQPSSVNLHEPRNPKPILFSSIYKPKNSHLSKPINCICQKAHPGQNHQKTEHSETNIHHHQRSFVGHLFARRSRGACLIKKKTREEKKIIEWFR